MIVVLIILCDLVDTELSKLSNSTIINIPDRIGVISDCTKLT